jgi:hypothetical protein
VTLFVAAPFLADESFEKSGFRGPGSEEDVARNRARGVAEQQDDGDDVVEWSDDRQELREQVDG